MFSVFYLEFIKKIEDRKKFHSEKILDGSCNTLESYRFAIGKIKGLEESLEILKSLYKLSFEESTDLI